MYSHGSLDKKLPNIIKKETEAIVATDDDEAGNEAWEKIKQGLETIQPKLNCQRAYFQYGNDPSEEWIKYHDKYIRQNIEISR